MKIEAEILSVPAGNTFNIIEATNVHACPNRRGYNYKITSYITFRKPEGIMESIYLIEDIIILNPFNKESIEAITPKYKKQVSSYIRERLQGIGFDDEDYRFYILSDKEELPHAPFRENVLNQRYFTFDELRSGNKHVRTVNELKKELEK
jgi:hypothetical protein